VEKYRVRVSDGSSATFCQTCLQECYSCRCCHRQSRTLACVRTEQIFDAQRERDRERTKRSCWEKTEKASAIDGKEKGQTSFLPPSPMGGERTHIRKSAEADRKKRRGHCWLPLLCPVEDDDDDGRVSDPFTTPASPPFSPPLLLPPINRSAPARAGE